MRIAFIAGLTLALVSSAAADLIISEVHDGPLTGGHPKFIELTNTGPGSIADLSIYNVSVFGNGSATVTAGPVTLAAVALAANDSYVLASVSQEFFDAYGFLPDEFGAFPFPPTAQNGDDTIVLSTDFTSPEVAVVDLYGVIGQDGTGTAWEFLDSSAYRNAGVTSGSASFETEEWTVMEENDNDGSGLTELAVMTNPGTHVGHLLTLSTERGTGDLDTPAPPLSIGVSGSDLVHNITPVVGGIGIHGSASAGSDVNLTDGATNAADNLSGLFADSGLANATPTTLSWTFADPGVFITGINSYCQNTGADGRVFQNCHIYLDLTNDSTDNPTFFTEVAVGSNNQNNTTDGNIWSALYLGVPSDVMGGGAVYGVRLDYYATASAGGDFRGEYDGEAGSIIKEVDIIGVAAPVELSVFESH